jgi:hypothetical protein
VVFDPASTGPKSARLVIQSNDGDEPIINVNLSGIGADQNLVVTPSSLSFGSFDIDNGPTAFQLGTISNTGTADLLVLTTPTLSGANPGDFAVTLDGSLVGPYPVTLQPGQSRTVGIVFDPVAVGARTAILDISTDDFNTQINLSGTASISRSMSIL